MSEKKKQIVRLTEGDVHKIIEGVVYQYLTENGENEISWDAIKGAFKGARSGYRQGEAENNALSNYGNPWATQDSQKKDVQALDAAIHEHEVEIEKLKQQKARLMRHAGLQKSGLKNNSIQRKRGSRETNVGSGASMIQKNKQGANNPISTMRGGTRFKNGGMFGARRSA